MKTRAGFTIVELLIVVVVIAILAVITIITYNGIQQQAYNTQVLSGVRSFVQVIESYKAVTGSYPQTTTEKNRERIGMACLGTGYEDEYCGVVTGADVYEDPDLNDELKRVIGSGSAISTTMQELPLNRPEGDEYSAGAAYGIDHIGSGHASVPGGGYARVLEYMIRGESGSCGVTGAEVWFTSSSPAVTGCIIIFESTPGYTPL